MVTQCVSTSNKIRIDRCVTPSLRRLLQHAILADVRCGWPAQPVDATQAFAEILRDPEIVRRWREMTLTPVGGTPDEVGAFLKAETARWRNVIVSGGIKRQ